MTDRKLVDTSSALAAVALWGLAFPLIQEGLENFSPILLGFLRFLIAAMAILAILLTKYKISLVLETAKKEWKTLSLIGALYVMVPNIAQNMGLEYGTSSVASVIQSSGPVLTLVFAVVLLKEKMTSMKAVGTCIAMGGTLLLVSSGGISLEDDDFVSSMLILGSSVSYALTWVVAKRMLERNDPVLVIALSLVIGTAMLGAAVPFEPNATSDFTLASVSNLLVLGVLCAAVSSVLYLQALRNQEVSRMAFLIYLMPVFASFFAWMIRDEVIAIWTIVCGIVILAGILIANRQVPENQPRATP